MPRPTLVFGRTKATMSQHFEKLHLLEQQKTNSIRNRKTNKQTKPNTKTSEKMKKNITKWRASSDDVVIAKLELGIILISLVLYGVF